MHVSFGITQVAWVPAWIWNAAIRTRTEFWFAAMTLENILIYEIFSLLTHWGRVTHICVGNLTIIGSDNGSSPGRRQAITWTNVGILLIRPLGTNFSEMLIASRTFSFKKPHLKMWSGKWRLFCLGLNVLMLQLWMFTMKHCACISDPVVPGVFQSLPNSHWQSS